MRHSTYIRRVQLKNFKGEMEFHELHSECIIDLDAQYLRLLRESETPPAPKSKYLERLEVAMAIVSSHVNTSQRMVDSAALEMLTRALVDGADLNLPECTSHEDRGILRNAYSIAVRFEPFEESHAA